MIGHRLARLGTVLDLSGLSGGAEPEPDNETE